MSRKKSSGRRKFAVKIFKSLWGMNARHPDKPVPASFQRWRVEGSLVEGATLEDPFGRMDEVATLENQFRAIRDAGYDGVESGVPQVPPGVWKRLCRKHNLEYIGLIFADNARAFREQLRKVKRYGPILVISHSGRDKMSLEQGTAFFNEALKIEADSEIPVAHETHRMRMFFSPFTTIPYLESFPTLKINADFSHWCVVCESLLEDLDDMVKLACSRAIHIHGRVGYQEGAQVPDPRAPENEVYLKRHESWWDAIRRTREAAGAPYLTFTPEFGPPDYMHTIPFSRQPVASLWDVCLFMAQRERMRWAK